MAMVLSDRPDLLMMSRSAQHVFEAAPNAGPRVVRNSRSIQPPRARPQRVAGQRILGGLALVISLPELSDRKVNTLEIAPPRGAIEAGERSRDRLGCCEAHRLEGR